MRRGGWIERQVGPELMDPDNWPKEDTSHLDDVGLKLFTLRKRAVTLYLTTTTAVASITEMTGLSRSEINRLLHRVFRVAPDGSIWGWAALLSRYRIVGYRRKSVTGKGKAGKFTQFLENHPDLEKQLDDWALARKPASGSIVRGRHFSQIWVAFEEACRKQGIDTHAEYPFSSKDRGRDAVRRYCKRVRKRHFVAGAAAEYGVAAGRMAATTKRRTDYPRIADAPYRHVQLDGHRMDVDLIVVLRDADGKEREYPLSRLWLLVLIDCASRAVLGYHISLEENYSADDVLQCIAKSVVPWQPMELPSPRLSYSEGAGLPSGVIEECAWRAFDVLRFDNAYAHTSAWVQERIIRTVCLEVVTNRPKRPRSDAIVERFMRTFEDDSLHTWPSTTGSSPTDPRRNDSEGQAKKLRVDFDDLKLVADMTIANYNAAPHAGLNGMSPLEYLRYRIDRSLDLIRRIPYRDPTRLPLFLRSFGATVRGSQKTAHLPYVQFMGVHYSNEALASKPELIGERVRLEANVLDIRSLELYWKGRSMGRVEADARWMHSRHSLRTRRAIMKLMKSGNIDRALNNPVRGLTEYLQERARLSRRDRNRLLKAQREAQAGRDNGSKPYPVKHRAQMVRGNIQLNQTHLTR